MSDQAVLEQERPLEEFLPPSPSASPESGFSGAGREGFLFRRRLIIINGLLLLALLGGAWGRRIEGATIAQPNFLAALNLPFENCATTDVALTAGDQAMLQPDSVLVRRYFVPAGDVAELAVIAGHRKRSIHTPSFCMAGGGWETISQQAVTLHVGGQSLPATRALMTRERVSIVATYFFTDGDYCSANLVPFQAMQLVKRFGAVVPEGALVRIIVPVTRSAANADHLSDEFAQATLPGVLASLRRTHLRFH